VVSAKGVKLYVSCEHVEELVAWFTVTTEPNFMPIEISDFPAALPIQATDQLVPANARLPVQYVAHCYRSDVASSETIIHFFEGFDTFFSQNSDTRSFD
jgi:hypothetical protein